MKALTYGRLEQILRSIGFSVHLIDGNAIGYQHQASGARVILPKFDPKKKLLPRHFMAVRTIMEAFGIPEPPEFAD